MNRQLSIVCVIGTRPEAIKMAPVVAALRASGWARCVVVATAQHRDLLDQMLDQLEVPVDHDLDLMLGGQTPAELVARMLPALDRVLAREPVDVVLAQGDTTTAFVSALAAFHRQIPFGHVEAGLRTHDLAQPFPEEGYRQMVARIAQWHFAPTQCAATHLSNEGVGPHRIHVTGNTGIDTLLQTVKKRGTTFARQERVILLTAHRRESFGQPLREIFSAVRAVVERYPDVRVVYPVHPNPNVRSVAQEMLGGHERIELCAPLDYFEFVDRMRNAYLILTDSGGVQEEAPALAKPVLVLRKQTERPEAIELGVARLVGTRQSDIVAATSELLDDPSAYAAMATGVSPYGDGHAAERIVDLLHGGLTTRDVANAS